MALATCKDCNREVSTLARHCVHCGRPRPAGLPAGSVIGGIAVAVLALALTGAVIFAARRACHRLKERAAVESQRYPRTSECSAPLVLPRAGHKEACPESLQARYPELIEVSPGLYRLKEAPAAAGSKEERN